MKIVIGSARRCLKDASLYGDKDAQRWRQIQASVERLLRLDMTEGRRDIQSDVINSRSSAIVDLQGGA